jgi:hypothetical protein
MNAVAWINLARGVFNDVKVWVDPESEDERGLIIQDFHQSMVQPFRQDSYSPSQSEWYWEVTNEQTCVRLCFWWSCRRSDRSPTDGRNLDRDRLGQYGG